MNPTLEVQITAKLDQLDAGLKVAEAKISKSAVTMGKTGEKRNLRCKSADDDGRHSDSAHRRKRHSASSQR